ncbi:MAG: hypothetical protein EXR59_04030 [Dehalococcoidia bacterium]|nr:hypothetical protein [Dehalococcoidia bacterium]
MNLQNKKISTWLKAVAATLASGVALVAASYVSAAALKTQAPFELLADQATRVIPASFFARVLDSLKYWGKPVLLTGLSAGWLALGSATALLAMFALWKQRNSSKKPKLSKLLLISWVTAVPLIVGGLIISPLAGHQLFGWGLPSGAVRFSLAMLISGAIFAQTVGMFSPINLSTPAQYDSDVPLRKTLLNRRDFVKITGLAILSIAGAAVFSNRIVKLLANAKPAYERQLVGVLTHEITTVENFYVVSKNLSDPIVDKAKWTLEISGSVDKPMKLTLDQLRAMPSIERYVTMICISNLVGDKLAGNALWKGVTLAEVLKQAGVKTEAKYLLSYAYDGYSESLPLNEATNVMIAYEMNGEPLTDKHGAPARLIIPGRYGMKSTKWLTKIELSTHDREGYWEERGWDQPAVIKTMSRIDIPARNSRIPQGDQMIGGMAFAGTRGIKEVQISMDAGDSWQSAELRKPLSPYTWTIWTMQWKAPKNYFIILSRAIDGTGAVQVETEVDPYPNGSSGFHRILVTVE